jgi:triosephosphate isomerase
MRQPLVAGNWKLNGNKKVISELVAALRNGMKSVTKAAVAVCPPYVYLDYVSRELGNSGIAMGAQNVCEQDEGAFTGEVAAPMLAEQGCRYVIIGHSERRQIYGETDELVAKKFMAVKRAGLIPILCVGETLQEREQGITEAVVGRQLDAVLAVAGVQGMTNSVLAYEPVWAIGTGKTASPEQAQAVHAFIRKKLIAKDAKLGNALQILYGGSVKGANAAELFAQPDIDGGLIGGASLKADEFLTICKAAV